MKKGLTIAITLIVLTGLNIGASRLFQIQFIDLMMFVGIIGLAVIRFFNSSGGFGSDYHRMILQSSTGLKVDREEPTFQAGYAFYTAGIYAVIGLIVIIISYYEYFI